MIDKGNAIYKEKKLIYKIVGKVKLEMNIYYPYTFDSKTSEGKLSAIVFFFGGGWSTGDMSHFAPQSKYLAGRGMIAICPQYRTQTKHKVNPDKCLEDAKSALRYVYAHAAELGIDKERILAGGGSAGGHLAASTVFCEKINAPTDDVKIECKPKALILFNPVVDNSNKGYGYNRVKDYWKDFSPMHNIGKNSLSTLFMIGDSDHLISVSTAEEFKKRIELNSGYCELIVYKNAKHGFFNKNKCCKTINYYKKTIHAMDKFLTKLGYLSLKN